MLKVLTPAGVLDVRVDARPLAVSRVMIGLAGLVVAGESWVLLRGLSSPDTIRVPWSGVTALPVSSIAADAWLVAVVLALVLLTVGLGSRAAAAAASVLLGMSLVWDQQVFSNHLMLAVLLTAFLAFGRPGGAWSLDSRLQGRTWTTPLCVNLILLTQVTAVYLFAGLSKLNGSYLSGSALETWAAAWVAVPSSVASLVAVTSVLTEIGLSAALWFPRTRVVAAVVGVLLHVSIVVVLDSPLVLTAFGLLTISTYPLFLTRPPLRPR